MFSRIRARLTLLYASMMVFFIGAFVAVCFFGVTYLTTYEINQEIRLLAREETEEQAEIYKHQGELAGISAESRDVDHDISNQVFYYVFDTQGNLTDSEEPVPAIRQAVRDSIQSWNLEEGETQRYTFQQSEGQEIMIIMTTRSIYAGHNLLGVVYMGKDISDYYRLLKRLFFFLSGLAVVFLVFAAVAAYFMAERAMIPIQQSFMRQKEFAADASHELRTPLSVLLASVDAIVRDEDNGITAFSRQVLGDMKDEIRKMSKIVADLLTLARADVGVAQLLRENFDLRPEAEQIIRNMQPLASEKQILLTLHSANSVLIYADRERLGQLLIILLDNAIKYTPPGGAVDLHMELLKQDWGRKLVLRIVDTGVGIALEHQARIFERFYRVDKVRSRNWGGTGLGLAIADWIVKEHGGTITVSSEPDQGTVFTVYIPV